MSHRFLAGSRTSLLCFSLVAQSASGLEFHAPRPAASKALSRIDNDLIDDVSRRSFRYFKEQTDPRTGLVLDRALTNGETEDNENHEGIASIAATGFGLTAFCIAADHRCVS